MKKKMSYILFFIVGAVIGGLLINHVPDALSFLNNGPFNILIFGALGFGVCAVLNKEYKKLLWVPLIIILAFIVTIPLLYLIMG